MNSAVCFFSKHQKHPHGSHRGEIADYVTLKHSLIVIRFNYLSLLSAETLQNRLQAKPELVPSLLTLALNDAMTYDKV